MYYVLIRYYYYNSGNMHARDDGPMVNGPGGPITAKQKWMWDGQPGWWTRQPDLSSPRYGLSFDTVQAAKDYLAKFGITRQLSPQKFSEDGVYVLAHGEYERPDYWIRKRRT